MILDNVATKTAKQIWASPDGQRVIYEVGLIYEGKPMTAKTYSNAVASEGWSGSLETYEKPGRNGPETFVKQPPKENPGYGGGSGRASRDDSHIKAQWAIGQAVGALEDKADFAAIEDYAKELFAMVDRVKGVAIPDTVVTNIPDDLGGLFEPQDQETENPWPSR